MKISKKVVLTIIDIFHLINNQQDVILITRNNSLIHHTYCGRHYYNAYENENSIYRYMYRYGYSFLSDIILFEKLIIDVLYDNNLRVGVYYFKSKNDVLLILKIVALLKECRYDSHATHKIWNILKEEA